MTYRNEDERKLLKEFTEWLERDGYLIKIDPEGEFITTAMLIEDFLKEREIK